MIQVSIFAFFLAFHATPACLATPALPNNPLEAEEIMTLIEVPDEDGTEGKTMNQVLFDAKTQVQRFIIYNYSRYVSSSVGNLFGTPFIQPCILSQFDIVLSGPYYLLFHLGSYD